MTGAPSSAPVRLRDAIAQRLGLQLDDGKLPDLARLLDRRLAATGCDETSYVEKLLAGDWAMEELGALALDLTVPETYFFRHLDQFDALREIVLPACLNSSGGVRRLNILSAGCASGEEAYSIAMLVRDMGLDPTWRVSIRAVDLNPAALRKARAGRFSAWALRETPASFRERWFTRDGQDFVIDGEIRRAVRFEQRNLVDPDCGVWSPGSYDIIFCRNAIMYLTEDKMRQVAGLIDRSLTAGGHLFLGHAETLRGLSDAFTLCQSHGAFYYRRGNAGQHASAQGASDQRAPGSAAPPIAVDPPPPAPSEALTWMDAIDKAARQIDKLATIVPGAPDADANMAAAAAMLAAQALAAEERSGEALDRVEACLADDPDHEQLRLLRAILLIQCGRAEEAEDVATGLLEHGDARAGAHHVLALCREKAGDLDSAREHDQAAAYADASFAMPRLHLGLLAKRAGRPAEMRRELARARILLRREDAARLAMFGGGFTRQALIELCAATLHEGSRRR